MNSYSEKYFLLHRYIYLYALLLIAVGLPFSEILLSFGQFVLVINWLWEGQFHTKWERFSSNKVLWVFLLLYIVHVIWLFNTQNILYAFKDLKIKLPLLVLPLLIGTSLPLIKKDIEKIIYYFIVSVFLASIIVFFVSLGIFDIDIENNRSISIFISHIRFSLMIDFSIFSIAVLLIQYWTSLKLTYRVFLLCSIFWFIFFLFVLQSITGIFIFVVFAPLFILKYILKLKIFFLKYFLLILLLTVTLLSISFLSHSIERFYTVEKVDFNNLPKTTSRGNQYETFEGNKMIENGHYIWINICKKELKSWWNQNSKIPFDSLDNKGQKIKFTLIRYMTSKGLLKDSSGCQKLTEYDIKNVETGLTNYLLTNKYSIYNMLYKILWQIDVYVRTGNSNNHSIGQRIEYFKTGINIFERNFWFGVGTGDVQDEFNIDYQLNESKLTTYNRHRTHNQFLTFCISFGVFGFFIILFALIYPVLRLWKRIDTLYFIFLIVMLLSFVNEDTLETQTGVTLFTFFSCLFLFMPKQLNDGKR